MPEEDDQYGLVAGKVDVLAQGWRGVACLGHGYDDLVGVRVLMWMGHCGYLEGVPVLDISQHLLSCKVAVQKKER